MEIIAKLLNLNDDVEVYHDGDFILGHFIPGCKKEKGNIIGIDTGYNVIIVGFVNKPSFTKHYNAGVNLTTSITFSQATKVSTSLASYGYYAHLDGNYVISFLSKNDIKSVNCISGNCVCKKCNLKNEYAVPNQIDGSFLCKGCKIFDNWIKGC